MARFSVPAGLLIGSAGCAWIASADLPAPVRALGAVPLVLYLPGRCLMAAAFPTAPATGETQALSAALSLAVTTLLGLALGYLQRLGPLGWVTGLGGVCLVGCLVCLIALLVAGRRPLAPANRTPLRFTQVAAFAIAAGLAVFSYDQASRGALAQRQDRYTDFWMAPVGSPVPASATVGVKNEEQREATYSVEIVARGALINRIPDITLRPGEARTFGVALPAVTFAEPASAVADDAPEPDIAAVAGAKRVALARLRAEARLYKDGDRGTVYRRVWLALPPPQDAAPTDADDLQASTRLFAPKAPDEASAQTSKPARDSLADVAVPVAQPVAAAVGRDARASAAYVASGEDPDNHPVADSTNVTQSYTARPSTRQALGNEALPPSPLE